MRSAVETAGSERMRIGRYVVVGRIGRGGMGLVVRARDEALERDVALKVLTSEGVLDADSRRRFAIEAKAAAQLQHPNIVTIFEMGEERGVPFIAMELLPGTDLESVLRSGEELLLTEKLDIVAQVCRGLAYAHERRIVHRDVKPSNVRLLDDGSVKLMDFGIAKLAGTSLTQAGTVVGTVHYMSPEQVRGQALDGRSDIFSAGVVLFELITGRRPFDGTSATEILYKIVHDPPGALSGAPETVAGALEGVLARALAKPATERYPSAAAMANELAAIQRRLASGRGADLADSTVEALGLARRLVKAGRLEEGIARLEAIVQDRPEQLEARRELRTARRERLLAERPATVSVDDGFPELAATFQLPPTQRAAETVRARPGPRAAAWVRWSLLGLGAAIVMLAVAAGALLLNASGGRGPWRLTVRSQPTGGAILVDGRDTGVVTDGEVVVEGRPVRAVLTVRKQGFRDAQRALAFPLADASPIVFALTPEGETLRVASAPPGARVTFDGRDLPGLTPVDVPLDRSRPHRLVLALDGYQVHEQTLAPDRAANEIVVTLERAGPPAWVAVTSSYPIDVSWNGKLLARSQVSPRVELTAGRQVLTLSAPAYSLKTSLSVEARAASTVTLAAPGLGRLNLQARPDNCQIFIDGAFVDFPPILDRPISAGVHRVQFRWPDGARSEETVEVGEGRSVFATGRRE